MITLLVSLVSSTEEIDYNLTGLLDFLVQGLLIIDILWRLSHGNTPLINYL